MNKIKRISIWKEWMIFINRKFKEDYKQEINDLDFFILTINSINLLTIINIFWHFNYDQNGYWPLR